MSMRRFEALLRGLPLDGALARSYQPDRLGRGWSLDHELTATLIEVLDRHDRHYILAHTKAGTQQPKPIYIPRPDDYLKGKPRVSKKQIQGFLAQRGIPIQRAKKRVEEK